MFMYMKELLVKLTDKEKDKVSTENIPETYACKSCGYKSSSQDTLKKHMEDMHSPNQSVNYPCDVCDEQFKNMDVLREHLQIHRKDFHCDQCLFKASSAQDIQDHIKRRHQQQFRCEMCMFICVTKEGIDEHEKVFHKIENYSCRVCAKTFKFSNQLKEHTSAEHETSMKKTYSFEERKRNGFCRFWNHTSCKFEESCKFLHEEAPHCRFQDRCRAKPACQYFHQELSQQNSSFLGYRNNAWNQGGWNTGRYL